MNKMAEFYNIFPENTFFPNFGGQFPALKLRASGLDPNTMQLRDRSTGTLVLNKLFMRLLTLLYSTVKLLIETGSQIEAGSLIQAGGLGNLF